MRWRSAAALVAVAALAASPGVRAQTPAPANCWEEAGARYRISPWLLYAIAQAESDLRPRAVNRSHVGRTGTVDIGLMQINSSHLRPGAPLAKAGWTERDLYEPCRNIHAGAWILAENIRRMGPKWDAVGAYNAACVQLQGDACTAARRKYIRRVWSKLAATPPQAPAPSPAVTPAPVNVVVEEPATLRIGGRG